MTVRKLNNISVDIPAVNLVGRTDLSTGWEFTKYDTDALDAQLRELHPGLLKDAKFSYAEVKDGATCIMHYATPSEVLLLSVPCTTEIIPLPDTSIPNE